MTHKKKTTLLPNATFTFEDTAVLMFMTSYENYRFAMELNKAYGLGMSRVEDVELEGATYPCFSYYDEYNRMAYVMIERATVGTSHPAFGTYDKMMLVRGWKAWEIQQQIYTHMLEGMREPDPSNLLEHRKWVLTSGFRQGVFSVDIFGFSQKRGTTTSLNSGLGERGKKATEQYMNRLQKFLRSTFEVLEWLICEE